jgi:hypothetical protein
MNNDKKYFKTMISVSGLMLQLWNRKHQELRELIFVENGYGRKFCKKN